VDFVHKFNNLKSSYHFLTNFLACCTHLIAFYPPLRNESVQCALPTHLYFSDSFQHSLKTCTNCTKFVYNVQNFLVGGWQKKAEGRSENGGRAPWLGGIDAPVHEMNAEEHKVITDPWFKFTCRLILSVAFSLLHVSAFVPENDVYPTSVLC